MNKLSLLLALAALFLSCQGATPTATPGNDAAANSYAFGVLVGDNLKSTGVTVDYSAFANGLKDGMEKKTLPADLAKHNETVQAAIAAAKVKLTADNLAKETEFLAANAKKAGVKSTASGLQFEVITEGTGANPKATDTVKVDYVGTLVDGTVFDSSIERKQPATFPLDGVIPGWAEGIQMMKVGGKYRLTIPSALAYGESGAGSKIGPNSTLVFEVTLLSIEAPAKK